MLLPVSGLFNAALILNQLRAQLTANNLDAFLIPYGGSHYDEKLAPCDARIQFVCGFGGSAGSVIVSGQQALLWTDGRYFLEAEDNLYVDWGLMKQGEPGVPTQAEWLRSNVNPGGRVGVAGWTYPKSAFDTMKQTLNASGIELVNMEENIVDTVWENFQRPDCPKDKVFDLPIQFSGKRVQDKLADVRKLMSDEGADLLLVSELDEVAWILNLRGTDLPEGSTFFGFVLVNPATIEVFLDEGKVDNVVRAKLTEYGAAIFNYNETAVHLKAQAEADTTTKVWLSKYVNARLADTVPVEKQLIKLSSVILMKSKKNDAEVAGMRAAHLRDSAAIIAMQQWLEAQLDAGVTSITEISVTEKLWDIRENGQYFMGQSFNTIAGFGSNGAIIHYRPTPATNKNVSKASLFLVDSGGLYTDGTCDITRTMHFGTPTDEQKDRYTRVLKGHIAVATALFPNKTPGRALDSFARRSLWDIGLEYKHGTGHGIGHYLNVHEGPQNIGSGYAVDDSGLEENMFVSNEPGYYKDGEYGIRIENIVRIAKAEGHAGFLGIDTVSLVPLFKKLIAIDLLSDEELEWVNRYHAECLEKVGKYIDDHSDYLGPEVREFLERETSPLERNAGSGAEKVAALFSSVTVAILVVISSAFH